MMRIPPLLLLLDACGGGGATADGGDPLDAAPVSCRHFGAFTVAPVTGANGAPLNASGIVTDPSVLREGDQTLLWYTSGKVVGASGRNEIARASSTDGIVFSSIVDPVLVSVPAEWDGLGIETVAITRDSTGAYRAWFTGDLPPDGSLQYAVGAATSTDGATWTSHAGPVLAPSLPWEQPVCADPPACSLRPGGTLEPSVVVDADGSFQLWYVALGELDNVTTYRIGHARSADGVAWTRDPDPVLTPGRAGSFDDALVSHVNVVADPAGGYHMFYFGSSVADAAGCTDASPCAFTPGAIGHAFSSDGIHWTRDAEPVLRATAATFAAWSLGGPAALIADGQLTIYFFGNADRETYGGALGRAQASCMP